MARIQILALLHRSLRQAQRRARRGPAGRLGPTWTMAVLTLRMAPKRGRGNDPRRKAPLARLADCLRALYHASMVFIDDETHYNQVSTSSTETLLGRGTDNGVCECGQVVTCTMPACVVVPSTIYLFATNLHARC